MSECHVFQSPEEMRVFASKWAKSLPSKCLVLLNGEMGVGKTFFVRSLVESFGCLEAASPTFAIHSSFDLGSQKLDHLDLYRLESEDDLESTGFWDLLEQDESWIFIEWANRVDESLWPLHWPRKTLTFFKKGEDQRQLLIDSNN